MVMKKVLAAMLALCLLLSATALAGVRAVPNQKLSFRTGPNTKYVELYTLSQSTSITAIEYEEGNGVTWVLVEFYKDGERVRAYTGLKRMSVQGNIPWANHAYTPVIVNTAGSVYAAPGYDGAYRGKVVEGETVELLRYDGDFVYIEFYDGGNRAPSRGWIPEWMVSGEGNCNTDSLSTPAPKLPAGGVSATPNQELAFRTGPRTDYNWMFHMPKSTQLTAIEYEQGSGVTWVLVEFFKDGERVRGYTGLKRMAVHGEIPWANHLNQTVKLDAGGPVYAAPSDDAGYRGNVFYGDAVTLLRWDGDYAYIEFYDEDDEAISRGWVPDWMIAGGNASGSAAQPAATVKPATTLQPLATLPPLTIR